MRKCQKCHRGRGQVSVAVPVKIADADPEPGPPVAYEPGVTKENGVCRVEQWCYACADAEGLNQAELRFERPRTIE